MKDGCFIMKVKIKEISTIIYTCTCTCIYNVLYMVSGWAVSVFPIVITVFHTCNGLLFQPHNKLKVKYNVASIKLDSPAANGHTNNYTCTCTSVCLEVSISNVIPESLDICPQLHLKQISQSSGITLLIHTPPDRMDCLTVSGCGLHSESPRLEIQLVSWAGFRLVIIIAK